MKWLMTLSLALLVTGCIKTKLNGWKTLIDANPTGFQEAVNGSHYRSMLIDGRSDGNASAVLMRSMGRYINDLEYRIESQ